MKSVLAGCWRHKSGRLWQKASQRITAAPDAPRLIETRVELTQVAPSQGAGMREGYLYLRLSLVNRDLKPVDYDASKIMLEIDGQGTSHAPAPRQGYSSMHYVQVDASRKAPHELDYLETGTILPGGSVTGWLRFQVPSSERPVNWRLQTWVLSGGRSASAVCL